MNKVGNCLQNGQNLLHGQPYIKLLLSEYSVSHPNTVTRHRQRSLDSIGEPTDPGCGARLQTRAH
jgi:hypothetical protein